MSQNYVGSRVPHASRADVLDCRKTDITICVSSTGTTVKVTVNDGHDSDDSSEVPEVQVAYLLLGRYKMMKFDLGG